MKEIVNPFLIITIIVPCSALSNSAEAEDSFQISIFEYESIPESNFEFDGEEQDEFLIEENALETKKNLKIMKNQSLIVKI